MPKSTPATGFSSMTGSGISLSTWSDTNQRPAFSLRVALKICTPLVGRYPPRYFKRKSPRRGNWMALSKIWIVPVRRKLPSLCFLDLKRGKPILTFLPDFFSFTGKKRFRGK
jgi:hypothetical protein